MQMQEMVRIYFNLSQVDYTPSNDDSLNTAEDVDNTGVSNTELFNTNFSLRKPL